jgi:hypothetical protein
MPTKEISTKEAREVFEWMLNKKQGFHVGQVSEEEQTLAAIVDEEPIVIFHNKLLDKRIFSCSDNHAEELEIGEIIKFPRP